MTKRQIQAKFDEIVDFSGIAKFLDTPVKHYSSGMYVRLAFAVAAHLEPEILLVDEVLAVGDAEFQKKCLGKMQDVSKQGKTVLFISHNMYAVQDLCSGAIFLESGTIVAASAVQEVIALYLKEQHVNSRSSYTLATDLLAMPQDKACLVNAAILNAEQQPTQTVKFGEPFALRLVWQHRERIPASSYAIRFYDAQHRFLCATNTLSANLKIDSDGQHIVICKVMHNIFVPGRYYLSIGCYIRPHSTIHVVEDGVCLVVEDIPYNSTKPFNIVGNPIFIIPSSWELSE